MSEVRNEQTSAPWKRVSIWAGGRDGRSVMVAGAWFPPDEAVALVEVENAARSVLSFAGWSRRQREPSRRRLVAAVERLDAIRRDAS